MTSTGEYRIPEFPPEFKTGSHAAVVTMTPITTGSPANTQTKSVRPFAQAAKPASTVAPLLLAGLFALTGVAGFVALSGPLSEDTPKPAQTTVLSGEPAATTVALPTAAPPKEKVVLVSLRSVPPGAMVLIGDKEYGPTPTQIEWRGADAQPGRQVTFRFRRTGYRALMVTREVHGDALDVQASFMDPLVRKPSPSEPTRAPRAAEPSDIDAPEQP
jgi:hypothetical protein